MIEKSLSLDLATAIRESLQRKQYQFSLKNYPAKIIDNDDPEQLGRCTVRVYGVYGDEIPDSDLPWATPDFNFIGSNLGSFVVPTPGTLVNVYFENGDFYQPRYTTKLIDKTALQSMSAGYDTDYPDTMVFFETESGDYFKINRATLEMVFRHASGLLVTCDIDGNITIDNTTTNGSMTIRVAGDANIQAQGDINVASNGKTTVQGLEAVVLRAIGSNNWVPNALPQCLYTGTPHGGPGAGITGLKGS